MNREDVAMDVTVQNVEILRKEVQAAKLLLSECDKVLEEDGGVYIELRAFLSGKMSADDVIALLASQQGGIVPGHGEHLLPSWRNVQVQGKPHVLDFCPPKHAEQAEGAQEVPSPVSQEYDRHLISLLRKGEALPGHQEEAADEIERLRDWNNHLNNTVLPNILNPNFLMLMKGGERLLDLCTKDGKFIGVSLNDMKDVFDWMVTHARIAPDHAALAQPSPTLPPFAEKVLAKLRRFYDCAEDFESGGVDIGRHWLDLLTQLGLLNRVQRSPALWEISQQGEDLLGTPHPSPAQAEKAEAERPEVVAYLFVKPDGTLSMDAVRHKPSQPAVAVMTVAQHERIVKAWIERWKAYIELSAKIAAQRDAALARVAELEAKLSDPTAVHQWQFSNAWFDGSEEVVLKAGKEGSPIRTLYAAPVAQAQHSVPELPEGWLIELGFDVLDKPFRFADRKSHLPTIKVIMQPCEVDDESSWNLRDFIAQRIRLMLAAAPQPVTEGE